MNFRAAVLVAIGASFLAACNCGGGGEPDSGSGGGSGGAMGGGSGGGASGGGSGGGAEMDAGLDDAGLDDAGLDDAGLDDAGLDDAGLDDAGLDDAGLDDAGLVDAGPGDAGCDLGSAASLATPGQLDLFGQISYFADGGALPSGRYRVAYVDGCMKYASTQAWTIHAYANGSSGWWLVQQTSAEKVLMPPGTVGYAPTNGAFTNFDDCVNANLQLAPVDFDFDGGVLGVWLQDSPYSDNLAGVDGRNPRWNLTWLSCP